jgi:hypothetical protein
LDGAASFFLARACTQGITGKLARVWGLARLTVGHRWLVGGRLEVEAFRRCFGSERAACRGWCAHVDAEIVGVLPRRDRQWRWLELDLNTKKGCMRLREARGSRRCREENRRRPAGDGNLPLLLGLRRWRSPSAEREGERGLAR